ncbi:TPA_asm: HNH endonuclease, partial [Cyanophage Cy-LDV1]
MATEKCTRERACVVCGQMHSRYKVCSDRCRELHNQSRKKAKRDTARMAIAALPRTCACCEIERLGERFKSATAVYCLDCVPAGLTEDQTTHRVRWLRNGGPQRQAEQERAKAERERTRTLDAAQRLLARIIGRQVREAKKGIAAERKDRMRRQVKNAGRELTAWNKPACAGLRSEAEVLRDLMRARAKSARRNGLVMLTDGTIAIEHVRGAESCLYCAAKLTKLNRVVDHMQPIALGGVHSASNVAQVCFKCNMEKGSKSWGEWLSQLAPEHRARAERHAESVRSLVGPDQWPALARAEKPGGSKGISQQC